MAIQITRSLEFDYGHRVLGHEGKCKALHGHRGKALITVQAPELDGIGRVVDFGEVKLKVGHWIDENWDHTMLLHSDDPLADLWYGDPQVAKDLFGGRRPFIMGDMNPTAENMAEVLFRISEELLGESLEVVRVRIYETPNCYADFIP